MHIDFARYLDSGYTRILPLHGKHPFTPALPNGSWVPLRKSPPSEDQIKRWQEDHDSKKIYEVRGESIICNGVGLITGPEVGVGFFDYDCIDNYPELMELIEKLVPKFSEMRRIGLAPKWGSFYKVTKEYLKREPIFLTNGNLIEIKCEGGYAVLDGVHPDTGNPYVWLDGNHLIETDKDSLPELPENLWDEIIATAKKYNYWSPSRTKRGEQIDVKKPLRKETGAGRHNDLLELCGALYAQNIPDRDIYYQLEVLDNSFPVSYFKTHKNTPEKMLESLKKSHERNHPKPKIVTHVEKPAVKTMDILDCELFTHTTLPPARGKHLDFINYCLSNSLHDETTLHFMSGMAWLSALLANRQAVKFRGVMWPANIFAFGVAESGHGKNVPNKALNALFDDMGILGHDDYPSSAGLLSEFITHSKEKELADGSKEVKITKRGKRELICVLDEIDNILLSMKAGQSFETRLTKVIIQVFDASRDQYGGQVTSHRGSEGAVKNPYLVITGTTQPKYFYKSLHGDIIYKGLYQRAFMFFPKKVGELILKNQANTSLLYDLKDFTKTRLKDWKVKLKTEHDFLSDANAGYAHSNIEDPFFKCNVDYRPIHVSEEANERLESIMFEIHKLIQKIQSGNDPADITSSILNRVLEKTIKAASVDWLSTGGTGPLTLENVEWGFRVATYNLKQIRNLFQRSAIEDTKNIGLEDDMAKLVDFAKKSGGCFTRKDVTKANILRGTNKDYRERVFSEAVDRGIFSVEDALNAAGRTIKLFKYLQAETTTT